MSLQIATKWFETEPVGDGVTLLWEPFVEPFVRCNIWHVRGRDRDLLVDTGLGVSSLRDAMRDLIDKPVVAVATHTHYDHVGGMYEFETRVVHPAEADTLANPPPGPLRLHMSQFSDRLRSWMIEVGYAPEGENMLTAYPTVTFDPAALTTRAASPTWLVENGDVIDLGSRTFEVLHVPGHTPGSIGLWDSSAGLLFSGDAVYDGPLLDIAPNSDIPTYIRTMEMLRQLPVSIVHGGHGPSANRARFVDLIDSYIESRSAALNNARGATQ